MIFVGFIKHHLLYALKLDQRVATLARTRSTCSPPFNTSGLSFPAHGVLLPLSMNHVHKFKLSHHRSAELARPQAQLWCNHGHEKDHQVLFAVKLQTTDSTPCSSFSRGCLVGLVARKAQPNLTSSSSSRARFACHTPPKRPVQSRNNLRRRRERTHCAAIDVGEGNKPTARNRSYCAFIRCDSGTSSHRSGLGGWRWKERRQNDLAQLCLRIGTLVR